MVGHDEGPQGIGRFKELVVKDINKGESQTIDVHTDMKFQSDIRMGDLVGTKIGTASTQKLAFYGSTPIVQAVLATGSTTDQLITALQNIGLIRQS